MTEETDIRLRYRQERGDILVTGIVEVLNESINQIIETRRGTRLFNRSFGSNVGDLLFEPMSSLVSDIILMEIQQAVETWEPRVKVLLNRSTVAPFPEENLYRVRIVYQILESSESVEFDTVLNAFN